jgi:aconitate hydratase
MAADQIKRLYESMPARLDRARKRFGRALTLAEKILVSHADNFGHPGVEPRQGAAAPARGPRGAAGRHRADGAAPVHAGGKKAGGGAEHGALRSPHPGAERAREDMERAISENREVYNFLHSASKKYGIGFWKPGPASSTRWCWRTTPSGRPHDRRRLPHAECGRAGHGRHRRGRRGLRRGDGGLAWEVLDPKLIGIRLTGKLSGWSSAKDIITYLCGLLTVKGGTNKIIEYFGPGAESISATGKGTICNMGAELGATTSLFHFDDRMAAYLRATDRADQAALAERSREHLVADPEVLADPKKHYDEVVEINLSELEPHIVGPHSPDRARPVSRLAAEVKKEGWPPAIKAALIGSCTNSSYEDMQRAAHIATQALKAGLKAKTPFLVTPGSERIYQTIKRDGIMSTFEQIGGTVLANACGPCIGQWKRSDVATNEVNTIVSSFNRNFPGRNDGSAATMSFLTSPEIVTAMAFAGSLEFDPVNGTIPGPDGRPFRFTAPEGEELPARGFAKGEEGLRGPRQPTATGSRSRSRPTASGSSSSSPSRGGTAGTSSSCPSWSRPRARPPPTTSRPRGRGSGTAGTSTRSATTCSWARSTRSPARRARAPTPSPARQARPSPRSRATSGRGERPGSSSATRTTARVAAASTPPCPRAIWAPRSSSSRASRASTRPTSRSKACCP